MKARIVLFLAAAALLVSCFNTVAPDRHAAAKVGTGSLKVVLKQGGGKTVVPDWQKVITSYQVSITSQDGLPSQSTTVENAATAYCTFLLDAGTWSIAVTAFSGSAAVGAGSATNLSVSGGSSQSVSITVSPTQNASGGYSFTFDFPSSTSIDYVSAQLISLSGTVYGSTIVASLKTSGVNQEGTIAQSNVNSGQYRLELTFRRGGSAGAIVGVYGEAVNIWDNVTSDQWLDSAGKLNGKRVFSATDFASSDTSLSDLQFTCNGSALALNPGFSSNVTSYTASANLDTVKFTPTQSIAGQRIQYQLNSGTWYDLASGTAQTITLASPSTALAIKVTAQDQASTATYTVNFPVTVSVGAQSTTISAGIAASVDYAVTMTNVQDGTSGTIYWYSDKDGTVVAGSSPTGISVSLTNASGNQATLSLSADTTAIGGTYYFRLQEYGVTSSPNSLAIQAVVVGTQSKAINAGTSDSATLQVATANVDDGTNGSFNWYADASGSTAVAPPASFSFGVSAISSGTATITVSNPTSSSAGTYYFSLVEGTAKSIVTPLYIVNGLVSPNVGEMVFVPGGTFQRDSGATDLTTVSSFYMGQNDITGAQYAAVTGLADPSYFSSVVKHPVEQVSWYDALVFCNDLSILEGRTPVYTINGSTSPSVWGAVPTSENATWDVATMDMSANGYRLPTEMEYQWAAMGGLSDIIASDFSGAVNVAGYLKGYAGSSESNGGQVNIGHYAWYYGNSGAATHSVGTKLPNELGIYDLTGNVLDWCWDWYNPYPTGSLSDYLGASSSGMNSRVEHAGNWDTDASQCPVSIKFGDTPNNRSYGLGFRVVLSRRVSVGTQSPLLDAGTAAQVYFTVSAANIPEGTAGAVHWYTDSSASTIGSAPTGASLSLSAVSGGSASLQISTSSSTPAGSYFFTVSEGAAVSNVHAFTIDKYSNNIGDMMAVAGGSFQRDASSSDITTVSSFFMSQYVINGYQFHDATGLSDPSYFTSVTNHPVEQVNWYAALVYCNDLSIKEGKTPVYTINGSTDPSSWGAIPIAEDATWDAVTMNMSADGYRLPTEAEYMWAAMGGLSDAIASDFSGSVNVKGYLKGYAGSSELNGGQVNIGQYAWYSGNSGNTTHNVVDGVKKPNELWLWGLTGNVWEWCWDWYGDYPSGELTDPTGAISGSHRVRNGGCWSDTFVSYTVSERFSLLPTDQSNAYGFRVVSR
jgi:formylglycine-generating enzyme required for sulfatase activity